MSSLSTAVFFFERFGVLRDLHSFPTRRSSDLLSGSLDEGPRSAGDREDLDERRARGLGRGQGPRALARAALRLGRVRGDRKSTRLNSSHPSISYAVFCLKKKTNQQPRPILICG